MLQLLALTDWTDCEWELVWLRTETNLMFSLAVASSLNFCLDVLRKECLSYSWELWCTNQNADKSAYCPSRSSNIYEFFGSCCSMEACQISLHNSVLSSSLYCTNNPLFICQDIFYCCSLCSWAGITMTLLCHWECMGCSLFRQITVRILTKHICLTLPFYRL